MEQVNSALRGTWCKGKSLFFLCVKKSRDLFSTPVFYIPLFLKIVASFFLASPHITESLVPFVKFFVFSGGVDPYSHFYTNGVTDAFPYPSLMLLILSACYWLIGLFSVGIHTSLSTIDVFLLRVPLLLADIGVVIILLTWFKERKKEILWLYWCSPVLFYITYIHGQLDVLPIFLLFCFLYFLFREYDYIAFIFLGLAISVKTGIVVVLPFAVLYLLKERVSLSSTFSKITIPITTYLLLNLFYIHNQAFSLMVLKTKEGFRIFDLIVSYGNTLVLYIVPGILLILIFYFATLKRYSRNVFMTFLGFSFFVLLLCIPPKQGWYFWLLPFAVYFYVQKPPRKWIPLHLLSLAYFIYFAVIKESDFFSVVMGHHVTYMSADSLYLVGQLYGLPVEVIVSLAFTFLQAMLFLNMYSIYKEGVSLYTKHKLYYRPFLLGIAGDSGSGKTTLTDLLVDIFSIRNTTVVAGDDMHKWERENEMWQDYTHLDPVANELHSDIQNVYTIKQGNAITRRQYDHTTGKFTEPKIHEAKRLVIFEGLHAFFLDKARKAFDLKIYIAPEDQLRLHWKILRDSEKRGYTKEEVVTALEKRKDDSEKFIAVQERYSDIVISLRNNTSLGKTIGEKDVKLSLSLFITCANDIYLQPLLDEVTSYCTVDYLITDEKQRLKFTGTIDAFSVQTIAEKLFPELNDISSEKRNWAGGYQGIMQLFVTFYIFKMLALEDYDK